MQKTTSVSQFLLNLYPELSQGSSVLQLAQQSIIDISAKELMYELMSDLSREQREILDHQIDRKLYTEKLLAFFSAREIDFRCQRILKQTICDFLKYQADHNDK